MGDYTRVYGVSKAYALGFAATPRNIRQSCWSARKPDGGVVLSLWRHQFWLDAENGLIKYSNYAADNDNKQNGWQSKIANKDRIEDLKHIQDNCNRLFQCIVVTAVDSTVKSWAGAYAHIQRYHWYELTSLNEMTGEFSAQLYRYDREQEIADRVEVLNQTMVK